MFVLYMYVYYAADFVTATLFYQYQQLLQRLCLFVFLDELKKRINILAYELDLIIKMNCTCD